MVSKRVINWLGGYASIDEAIEAIRTLEDRIHRREILTLAVKRLYNTVGVEDILKTDINSGQLTFQGKHLTKEETTVIIEEAKWLINSKLWKILESDMKYQANKRMFVEAIDPMQLEAGKLLVFLGDIIHTRLKRLIGK